MFKCTKCGVCCENLSLSSLYIKLDRGDEVCIYYDSKNKLCSIYNNRPIICNIDAMYKMYFYNEMSLENYYKLNYEFCNELKLRKK